MHRIYTEYGTKTKTEPTEASGIYSFVFISYMCRYEFETFGATSDKIRLKAFYLNPDFTAVRLKTWLSTSDEIGIIT
jgi:hypothetical protein